MKKITLILVTLFCTLSCKNDDDNLTPIEQLPQATQMVKVLLVVW